MSLIYRVLPTIVQLINFNFFVSLQLNRTQVKMQHHSTCTCPSTNFAPFTIFFPLSFIFRLKFKLRFVFHKTFVTLVWLCSVSTPPRRQEYWRVRLLFVYRGPSPLALFRGLTALVLTVVYLCFFCRRHGAPIFACC